MYKNISEVKVGTYVGGVPPTLSESTPENFRVGKVIFVSEKRPWCTIQTVHYTTVLEIGSIYSADELVSMGIFTEDELSELRRTIG